MWNDRFFCRVVWDRISAGSKESDWWSEIRCCHDNFKACHGKSAAVTERALQSRNLRLFGINTIFVFVFESQTLSYKPNPISWEKISQTFVSNTEKIARLIGEEIRYADYLIFLFRSNKNQWNSKLSLFSRWTYLMCSDRSGGLIPDWWRGRIRFSNKIKSQ